MSSLLARVIWLSTERLEDAAYAQRVLRDVATRLALAKNHLSVPFDARHILLVLR